MNQIKCPHCNKEFKIDEAGYAEILQQVRNQEFDKELHERLEIAEKEKLALSSLQKKRQEISCKRKSCRKIRSC